MDVAAVSVVGNNCGRAFGNNAVQTALKSVLDRKMKKLQSEPIPCASDKLYDRIFHYGRHGGGARHRQMVGSIAVEEAALLRRSLAPTTKPKSAVVRSREGTIDRGC
jgi:hypothetical protein